MKKTLTSIILIFFASLSIWQYAGLVMPYLKIQYSFSLELFFMIVQLLIQVVLLYFHNKTLLKDYIYAKSLALGIGAGVMWFFIGIFYLYPVSAREALMAFIFSLAVIYAVHQERVYALKLPYYFCYTWVLYRIIVFTLLADF
jgi:hypothetical protein